MSKINVDWNIMGWFVSAGMFFLAILNIISRKRRYRKTDKLQDLQGAFDEIHRVESAIRYDFTIYKQEIEKKHETCLNNCENLHNKNISEVTNVYDISYKTEVKPLKIQIENLDKKVDEKFEAIDQKIDLMTEIFNDYRSDVRENTKAMRDLQETNSKLQKTNAGIHTEIPKLTTELKKLGERQDSLEELFKQK